MAEKKKAGRPAGSVPKVNRHLREKIQEYLATIFPGLIIKLEKLLEEDPYTYHQFWKVLMDKAIPVQVQEDSKGKTKFDHEKEILQIKHQQEMEKLEKMKEMGINGQGEITVTIKNLED